MPSKEERQKHVSEIIKDTQVMPHRMTEEAARQIDEYYKTQLFHMMYGGPRKWSDHNPRDDGRNVIK